MLLIINVFYIFLNWLIKQVNTNKYLSVWKKTFLWCLLHFIVYQYINPMKVTAIYFNIYLKPIFWSYFMLLKYLWEHNYPKKLKCDIVITVCRRDWFEQAVEHYLVVNYFKRKWLLL